MIHMHSLSPRYSFDKAHPSVTHLKLKTHLSITSISVSQSFWKFAHSAAVSLPCSAQNFKIIGQLRNQLWANENSQHLRSEMLNHHLNMNHSSIHLTSSSIHHHYFFKRYPMLHIAIHLLNFIIHIFLPIANNVGGRTSTPRPCKKTMMAKACWQKGLIISTYINTCRTYGGTVKHFREHINACCFNTPRPK